MYCEFVKNNNTEYKICFTRCEERATLSSLPSLVLAQSNSQQGAGQKVNKIHCGALLAYNSIV